MYLILFFDVCCLIKMLMMIFLCYEPEILKIAVHEYSLIDWNIEMKVALLICQIYDEVFLVEFGTKYEIRDFNVSES